MAQQVAASPAAVPLGSYRWDTSKGSHCDRAVIMDSENFYNFQQRAKKHLEETAPFLNSPHIPIWAGRLDV